MCFLKTPSNLAGSAASASRERSFRASVLNSTLMQPSAPNACSSMSSFASTFAPVLQAERRSQVQPISRPSCSGRGFRYEELPINSSAAGRPGDEAPF